MQSRAQVLGSTPRVRIRTPSLQGSINLKGAQIDDLVLVKQRTDHRQEFAAGEVAVAAGCAGRLYRAASAGPPRAAGPTSIRTWTADSQLLTPGRPVTLTTRADGVRYQVKVAVDDGYLFTVQQRAINASGKPVVLRPIGLVSRADKTHDPDSWTMHVGPMTVFGRHGRL